MPDANPQTTPCARCGAPCRLAPEETDRPEVNLLRGKASTAGVGICASCNATAFLQDPCLPIGQILGAMPPEKRAATLALPFIQEQFREIVRLQPGGVGLDPATVDWERVARNWDLPHPRGTYGGGKRRRRHA